SGWGQHRIAGWLNVNAAEPWGRGKHKGTRWHRSYVRKVLTNPVVVGTFTPHVVQRDPHTRRKTRKPLEPIHHRFPPIVDREAFVTAIRGTIDEAPRGKDSAELDKEIANADAEGLMKYRNYSPSPSRRRAQRHARP